jgi:hypothetical protein
MWKPRVRPVSAFLILAALLAPVSPVRAQEYEYRYHTYAESVDRLERWVAAHPNLARLFSIGPSATGTMDLWVVEITNRATGPAEEKPAAYFDGNQHDSEVMGGETALHLVWWLLSRYGSDSEVTELLDTRTVYVLPLANPEGAEYHITGKVSWDPYEIPGRERHYRPGRRGADGPEDLTGDGNILQMRVEDPDGEWKPYEGDSRLLVRRTPEDTDGPFYRLYSEGLDSNGDGEINSDPPFTRFITNRNYPAFWSSHDARFRGAGRYPLDEPNARAIVDFILSRPHIALIESYHTTSGVHLRPYAARPDSDMPPQDLADYAAILSRGARHTTYPQASVYHQFTTIEEGLDPDAQPGVRRGVFIDWGYAHFGVFSNTTELWTMEPFVNEVGWGDIPRDEPLFAIPGRYSRPDVQARILQWLDRHAGDPGLAGQGFRDWKPFDHPTLGRVEIGGWTRYWLRNPPPGPFLQEIAVGQARFAVERALKSPLVRMRGTQVEWLGDDRWRVTVQAANTGWLDTSMEHARRAGLARPDELRIRGDDGVRMQGDPVVRIPFMRGTRGGEYESRYHGSWVVEGPSGAEVTVEVRSEKGGVHRERVRLTAASSMGEPVLSRRRVAGTAGRAGIARRSPVIGCFSSGVPARMACAMRSGMSLAPPGSCTMYAP